MRSTSVAYLLWLLGLVGVCGIHRFYLGKWGTGILWLLTGGLLFIGQLIDLVLIPGIVERSNTRERLETLEHERMRRAFA
jgi:TM2 domain-containing membrane protein YozV